MVLSSPQSQSDIRSSATAAPMVHAASAVSAWHETVSTASHTSSSRFLASQPGQPPNTSQTSVVSSSGSVPGLGGSVHSHQPLSLADALARAGADTTRALDEVLAERNKFCLEAAKLNSENVRIWNLMGRIRKENEVLKARLHDAERGPGGLPRSSPLSINPSSGAGGGGSSGAGSRAGHSAAAGGGGSASASPVPHPNAIHRRRGAELDTDDGSFLASPSGSFLEVEATPRHGMAASSPSSSTSGVPHSAPSVSAGDSAFSNVVGIDVGSTGGGAVTNGTGSGITSGSAADGGASLSSSSLPNATGFARKSFDTDAGSSHAHSSIMQQRATIKAQQRLVQSEKGLIDVSGRGGGEGRDEFEAIDDSPARQPSPQLADAAFPSVAGKMNASSQSKASPWIQENASSHAKTPASPGASSASGSHRRLASADVALSPGTPQSSRVVPGSVPSSPRGAHVPLPQSGSLLQMATQASAAQAASSSSYDRDAKRSRGYSVGSNQSSTHSALTTPAAPRLDTQALRYVNLAVVGSNLRSNERGKEVVSFLVEVEVNAAKAGAQQPASSSNAIASTATWRIEKLYSDILALDARLKQKHGKSATKRMASAQLPDKALFRDNAPSKVDQRKIIIEVYLQNLLAIPLPDKDDLCTFLCTDVAPPRSKDSHATNKEGFLTKKGQNMGRWVTRFYALRDNSFDYFETRGGTHMGTINISGAQIGRQQRSAASDMDENSYRHAFLILEKRPPAAPGEPPQMVRHVLCAESDDERDEWVDVLVRAIADIDRQERAALKARTKASSSTTGSSSVLEERHEASGSSRGPAQSERPSTSGAVSLGPSAGRKMAEQLHQHHHSPPPSNQPTSPMSASFDLTRSQSDHGRYGAPIEAPPLAVPDLDARSQLAASRPISQQAAKSANSPDAASSSLSQAVATTSKASSGGKDQRPAISGPINGQPIPSGYKFGKDEPQETAKKDEKRRFWHRFGGGGGSHAADKAASGPRPVFGVPLVESIAVSSVSEGLELPSVVYRCIQYLEKRNAAMEEGIYRLSGSSASVKALKDRFNAEGDVDLLAPHEPFYDPHAVAGLLKTFLRDLPSSVLTTELHLDFMRANDIVDRRERVNELGKLVSMLPLPNYSLLRTLCGHLIRIIELADHNKMTMRNVGIVFSPTLGIPAGVFALFLTEFDWVFYTDARGEPAPKQMEADIEAPDSSELGNAAATFAADPLQSPPRSSLGGGGGSSSSTMEDGATAAAVVARNKKLHRGSWMVGNALHAGNGDIVQLRSNRNSLQYDQDEAEKLLGPRLGSSSGGSSGGGGGGGGVSAVGNRLYLAEEDEAGIDEAGDLVPPPLDELSVPDLSAPPTSSSLANSDAVAAADVAGESAGTAALSSPIGSGGGGPASLGSPTTRTPLRTPHAGVGESFGV